MPFQLLVIKENWLWWPQVCRARTGPSGEDREGQVSWDPGSTTQLCGLGQLPVFSSSTWKVGNDTHILPTQLGALLGQSGERDT